MQAKEEEKKIETCPICSHPLEKSSVWISGEAKAKPEEIRCGSPACIGHTDPAAMNLHRVYVARLSRPGFEGFNPQKQERKGT